MVPTLDAKRLQDLDGAPSWIEGSPGALRSPEENATAREVRVPQRAFRVGAAPPAVLWPRVPKRAIDSYKLFQISINKI